MNLRGQRRRAAPTGADQSQDTSVAPPPPSRCRDSWTLTTTRVPSCMTAGASVRWTLRPERLELERGGRRLRPARSARARPPLGCPGRPPRTSARSFAARRSWVREDVGPGRGGLAELDQHAARLLEHAAQSAREVGRVEHHARRVARCGTVARRALATSSRRPSIIENRSRTVRPGRRPAHQFGVARAPAMPIWCGRARRTERHGDKHTEAITTPASAAIQNEHLIVRPPVGSRVPIVWASERAAGDTSDHAHERTRPVAEAVPSSLPVSFPNSTTTAPAAKSQRYRSFRGPVSRRTRRGDRAC